tara:strand:- start:508 stop:771 length:264 start_codon:yes stop_codon:yes gene_type:complete
MKKNIWVINQFAGNPKSGWGERHYFFSKYWIRKGYNVSIISGSYNHVFKTLPTVKKILKLNIMIPHVFAGLKFLITILNQFLGFGAF